MVGHRRLVVQDCFLPSLRTHGHACSLVQSRMHVIDLLNRTSRPTLLLRLLELHSS